MVVGIQGGIQDFLDNLIPFPKNLASRIGVKLSAIVIKANYNLADSLLQHRLQNEKAHHSIHPIASCIHCLQPTGGQI
jgi:hypothetical protein